MKRLLSTVSLATIVTTIPAVSTVSSNVTIQNNFQNFASKTWNFEEQKISKLIAFNNDYLYFAIDNINLTSIGIFGLNDLHNYKIIKVPGIKISGEYIGDRGHKVDVMTGDTFKTNRKIGSEDWYQVTHTNVRGFGYVDIYTAVTLWFNVDTGNLMMRLAYKSLVTNSAGGPPHYLPFRISLDSGSRVEFVK